jgi:hypothetical protein
MSMPKPTEGRATLARSYRNLSEREIHAKLEGAMSDAERVTAKAELLRRNSGNNGPDTTLATGFAPTSAFDVDTPAGNATGAIALDGGARRGSAWPWVVVAAAAAFAALGWAIHGKLLHLG